MAGSLRLGTRGSKLALWQAEHVAAALRERHPAETVELQVITTQGDRAADVPLQLMSGQGVFARAIEDALLAGRIDLAVHSLKDLPVTLPAELTIGAFPRRADPRDVLVSEIAADLDGLPAGAIVLTGALRRRAQILLRRPDLRVEALRGNVDTRLRRWRERGAGAVVLAGAGLSRLGLLVAGDLPVHPLPPEVMLPAPGQGTLALEVRRGGRAESLCRCLDDAATAAAAAAERRVVAAFGGDCTLPLAAWARWETPPAETNGSDRDEAMPGWMPAGTHDDAMPRGGGRLRLTALLATPDGRHVARGEAAGADPANVAAACIAALGEDGAEEVLAKVRADARRE
jgi:hydroxymethylbilane synthase